MKWWRLWVREPRGLFHILSRRVAVWPDLAKFHHFGKSLQINQFFTVYFWFGKMLSLIWQICDIIGLIFIVANGQILKNNLTIWSHCWRSKSRFGGWIGCAPVLLRRCALAHRGWRGWGPSHSNFCIILVLSFVIKNVKTNFGKVVQSFQVTTMV